MSFITIKSLRRVGQPRQPDNLLRLSKNNLSLSGNVAERFQTGRTTKARGREVIKMGIAIDPQAKQIKLLPNEDSGFSFSTTGKSGTLHCRYPKSMERIITDYNMLKGDFEMTDESNLVFTLAE